MASRPLRSPVVLFLYARPDTTAQLVELVRAADPPQVLVVADGPRAGDADAASRCAATRAVVAEAGWDCEVLTDYAVANLGLKRRIETGLDWAFEQVEEAIVLEDDCLPHPTFFRFCDELLERFRDDERVLSISGDGFRPGDGRTSYRFSRYQHIWGWATWRRAWRLYDPLLLRWPELRDAGWLDELLGDGAAVQHWTYLFEQTYTRLHTWDYAWLFASWLAGGLSAVPERNLVTNVGFRDDATSTRPVQRSRFSEVAAVPMGFPLRHPRRIERDDAADRWIEEALYSGNIPRLFARLRARLPEATAR